MANWSSLLYAEIRQVNEEQKNTAHNHPSGDITPSQEDLNVTKRIAEAGKLMGIKLLDDLIIGDDYHCSLAQSNPDLLR